MAITHASGPSRIRALDLPDFIRQEFDFDVKEIEQALREEVPHTRAPVEEAPEELQDPKALIAEARDDLLDIETRISEFQLKKELARSEASNARIQARRSKNRSSPNGLDTWDQWAAKQELLAKQYAAKIIEKDDPRSGSRKKKNLAPSLALPCPSSRPFQSWPQAGVDQQAPEGHFAFCGQGHGFRFPRGRHSGA